MMKTADLRTKSADELKQELLVLRKEQLNTRFQKKNGQLENTARIRVARRGIAKIKTLLNEMKSGKTVVAKSIKKVVKATTAAKKKKESKE